MDKTNLYTSRTSIEIIHNVVRSFCMNFEYIIADLMPTAKTSLRISLFKIEKTKWKAAAKRHRLGISDFVRWTVNTKVRIPTVDLAKKLEKKLPEQMSIIDATKYDAQFRMF